jgi:ribulose-5-phosphate 4-epimerase/fuculose-1-phosphate aldolase
MIALEPSLRQAIVECGRQLAEKELVTATHGSISALLDKDIFLCTPAGTAKGALTRDMLVKLQMPSGRRIGMGKPTSAWPIHAALYAAASAGAIVHAQPASVLHLLRSVASPLAKGEAAQGSVAGVPVLVVGGGCADSTAEAVARHLDTNEALFSADLGLFVWADTVKAALARLIQMENSAVNQQTAPSQAASAAGAVDANLTALVAQISRNVAAALAQGNAGTSETAKAGSDASRPASSVIARPAVTVPTNSAAAPAVATQATATAPQPVTQPSACATTQANSSSANPSCMACGRCTNNGGSLPSAKQEAIDKALQTLPESELIAIITAAAREVLTEKGLLS